LDLDSYSSYITLIEEHMEAFVMGYGANLGEVHPYLSTSSNKPTIEESRWRAAGINSCRGY